MRSAVVSLVGMPGSGKTTVGKYLARKLGRKFLDSDAIIEEYLGCSIREYFMAQGEAKFREVESEVILRILEEDHIVLSTGGGAVLRAENRQALHAHSSVVYLRSSPEDILRRIGKDTKRPLLQVDDPLKKLKELYQQRHSLYTETAHLSIDTGKPSVYFLVQKIMSFLELDARLNEGDTAFPPVQK